MLEDSASREILGLVGRTLLGFERLSLELAQGRLLGPRVARGRSGVSRALLVSSFASFRSAAGAGSDLWELREKPEGGMRGTRPAGRPLETAGSFVILGPRSVGVATWVWQAQRCPMQMTHY